MSAQKNLPLVAIVVVAVAFVSASPQDAPKAATKTPEVAPLVQKGGVRSVCITADKPSALATLAPASFTGFVITDVIIGGDGPVVIQQKGVTLLVMHESVNLRSGIPIIPGVPIEVSNPNEGGSVTICGHVVE
jgi:hypothetical protein